MSHRRIIHAVLLTMLCFAVPVHAEFSPIEKNQVLAQIIALHDLNNAGFYLTAHAHAFPADFSDTVDVLERMIRTKESHWEGLMYLLDWEAKTSGDTIGRMSRDQARAEGIQLIQRASYAIPLRELAVIVDRCRVACGSIKTAQRLIQGAEDRRTALDATLPFIEPRLAENCTLPCACSDRRYAPTGGPHGDYRRFGRELRMFERSENKHWLASIEAARMRPDYRPTWRLNVQNISRTARYRTIWAGLMVGVEHPSVVQDLDTMYSKQGKPGLKPRHFFSIQIIQEQMLGLDHLAREAAGDYSRNVYGRKVYRGATYDLLKACNQDIEYLRGRPDMPEAYKKILESVNWSCQAWAEGDNIAWNVFVLRYFTTIGMPGCKEEGH